LREAIQSDAAAYGLEVGDNSDGDDQLKEAKANVKWAVLSENIKNYIRSLNFKYRVRLREKEVTYINKLAKFVDEHTIEATDKKGDTSTITASRFLIAVGGRPTPLECEGGDLAISSDDVFFLEKSPGKTLCVGASYISLECAGFLNGLGFDVTVAVRSILLRGFDRECSGRIEKYMEETGVKFRHEVTPVKLLRTDTGQIKVIFSNGSEDTYDTVLAAVGRKADTDKLGLEKLGIKVNPNNNRIIGKHEQTDCPNVYAVGDVLDVRNNIQIYIGMAHAPFDFPLSPPSRSLDFSGNPGTHSSGNSSRYTSRKSFVRNIKSAHGLQYYLHDGFHSYRILLCWFVGGGCDQQVWL
jgi:thioredoxin reductase (NADPH)